MNTYEYNLLQEIHSLEYLYNKCISLKKTRNIIWVIFWRNLSAYCRNITMFELIIIISSSKSTIINNSYQTNLKHNSLSAKSSLINLLECRV